MLRHISNRLQEIRDLPKGKGSYVTALEFQRLKEQRQEILADHPLQLVEDCGSALEPVKEAA